MGYVIFLIALVYIMNAQSTAKSGGASNPDDNEVRGNPGDWNNYNDR